MHPRRSTRVSADRTIHLQYDQKYHPLDVYTRPSNARKRKRAHDIAPDDHTSSGNEDIIPLIEAQSRDNTVSNIPSISSGIRSSKRHAAGHKVLYNGQIHPQDDELAEAGVIRRRRKSTPKCRRRDCEVIGVMDEDERDTSEQAYETDLGRSSAITDAAETMDPSPEKHSSAQNSTTQSRTTQLARSPIMNDPIDVEIKKIAYIQAWESFSLQTNAEDANAEENVFAASTHCHTMTDSYAGTSTLELEDDGANDPQSVNHLNSLFTLYAEHRSNHVGDEFHHGKRNDGDVVQGIRDGCEDTANNITLPNLSPSKAQDTEFIMFEPISSPHSHEQTLSDILRQAHPGVHHRYPSPNGCEEPSLRVTTKDKSPTGAKANRITARMILQEASRVGNSTRFRRIEESPEL